MINHIHTTVFFRVFLCAILLSTFGACDMSRFNENPNASQSSDVSLDKLLPAALYKSAKLGAGQTAVCTGIFSQYFTGIVGKELQFENYEVGEAEVNTLWNDAYSTMNALNVITRKANDVKAPHYSGIAKIMMAYSLATSTDFWGDMPHSDAFRGSNKINPLYDKQESIYNTIQYLLTDGIREVASPESALKPAKDDVIFGGNMVQWRRAGYALKARYYMHLASERTPKYIDSALICTNRAFISENDKDLEFIFTGDGVRNPLYEYFSASSAAEIDPILLQLMYDDPRQTFYFNKVNGKYRIGKHFDDPKAALPLVTYEEMKLLEAEIYVMRGTEYIEDAQAALQKAIYAHIKKVTNSDATDFQARQIIDGYIEKYGTLTNNATVNMEKVMQQLYILHFGQSEGWMDIRRRSTSLKIAPNDNGTNGFNPNGDIPKRLPYPESERLYNANFPKNNVNLQSRLWFDKF